MSTADEQADALLAGARRRQLLDQAADAVARLEADPLDHAARGSLGEALSKLDEVPELLEDARRRFLVVGPPDLPVRTERLLLRRVEPGDAVAMHGYYGRDDVARHLLHPPYTLAEMEAEVRRRTLGPQADDALGLVIELDGEVVGDLVLMLKPPSYVQAEIGWVLSPDVAGRGIATEAARALLGLAFDHYRVLRVHAELDARNDRSALLAERLGMRREAHRRQDYWSKGEWTDSLQYGLTASEWAARS